MHHAQHKWKPNSKIFAGFSKDSQLHSATLHYIHLIVSVACSHAMLIYNLAGLYGD